MNAALPLLAALDENDQILLQNVGHTATSQIVITFSALALVIILVFLFVFVFRKRLLRKRKRHHHHRHHRESAPAAEATPSKRRKWRRPRREHRPLNPTLAQTHGLPPIRDPNQPPPGL